MANDQQVPQLPWFFILVTLFWSTQFKLFGKAALTFFMFYGEDNFEALINKASFVAVTAFSCSMKLEFLADKPNRSN